MELSDLKETRLVIDWNNVNFCMKYTVKNRPCVYVIRNKAGAAIRIGKATTNLAYRLKNYQQYGRKYYKEVVDEGYSIIIYEVPGLLHDIEHLKAQLKFIEELLTAVYQPIYNIDLKIVGERKTPLTEAREFVYQK